jgi:hypothetical protein
MTIRAAVASPDRLNVALRLKILVVSLAGALALLVAPTVGARGGSYTIDGGTTAERTAVRDALAASSFDWSLVPVQVKIHVVRGVVSHAVPGEIWLDGNLLDSGRFAWGVVQHEYAHQVDFFVLTDEMREQLADALGTSTWCDEGVDVAHSNQGCERFASTLAWAYWQNGSNCLKPQSKRDEAGAIAPASFRALLARLLHNRSLQSAARR